jgi:RNA 2',3'-cyclic 3'-phosphodiesterase
VRLFVAVDLPPPITQLLEALPRPRRPDLRWTTPAQWHITLRFLGEVDEVAEVVEAVGGIAGQFGDRGVEARLGPATAWFPGRRVLQVPVAGLDEPASLVHELTARWGPDREPRYAGHVTLARVRGRGAGPAALAGAPVEGRFAVTHVTVFASVSRAEAVAYEVVADVPMARGHPG